MTRGLFGQRGVDDEIGKKEQNRGRGSELTLGKKNWQRRLDQKLEIPANSFLLTSDFLNEPPNCSRPCTCLWSPDQHVLTSALLDIQSHPEC